MNYAVDEFGYKRFDNLSSVHEKDNESQQEQERESSVQRRVMKACVVMNSIEPSKSQFVWKGEYDYEAYMKGAYQKDMGNDSVRKKACRKPFSEIFSKQ